jgi:hypothetical protein
MLFLTRCWRLANNWNAVTRLYTNTYWRDANKKITEQNRFNKRTAVYAFLPD